jgi:hypothetical protein
VLLFFIILFIRLFFFDLFFLLFVLRVLFPLFLLIFILLFLVFFLLINHLLVINQWKISSKLILLFSELKLLCSLFIVGWLVLLIIHQDV